jgi:hypothetical protein
MEVLQDHYLAVLQRQTWDMQMRPGLFGSAPRGAAVLGRVADWTTQLCEDPDRGADGTRLPGVDAAAAIERGRLAVVLLEVADEWGVDLHTDCDW